MSTSNVELRNRMFGTAGSRTAGRGSSAESGAPSPMMMAPAHSISANARSLLNWVARDEPLRPNPAALSQRMVARALAAFVADPPGRLAFADSGKGLAIMLVILSAALTSAGKMPEGFVWLSAIGDFLEPFALPSFLVFAGMFLQRSRDWNWSDYIVRKTGPFVVASAAWLVAASGCLWLTQDIAPKGISGFLGMAGTQAHLAIALFILPLFFIFWKTFGRMRTGTIFVLAAIMEILHTDQGGVLWVELMRGFVYFTAGHCLAQNFRGLARYVRENPVPAASMLAAWAAFNGLMTSASLPLTYGFQISVLPFASLGLGLAGAAAMVVAGQLIAGSRFNAFFSLMGRKWIFAYATLPLALVFCGQAMVIGGLFPSSGHAIAALLSAVVAAGAALILLELRNPAPQPQTAGQRNM